MFLAHCGQVKHSFFGLSQPKSKYFTQPWGPEIFACGNLAAFRLATFYLPQRLLLKWAVVKYSVSLFYVIDTGSIRPRARILDPRGTEIGVTYLPSALAQTLAMPIYPYPYWVPQSTLGLW